MVRVSLAATPSEVGALELRSDKGEAGTLTSWATSLGGLAIVKRALAERGVQLHAGDIAVTVVSGPLGDDPGRGGRAPTATVTLGGRR
jgi:hypothetical protein